MAARSKLLGLTLALSTLVLLPRAAFAQEEQAADAAAMIASALSAAPEAITATATITDLDGNVLRQGTSGFTCMPDDPEIPGNGPICLDAGWGAFINAWINQENPPRTGKAGIHLRAPGRLARQQRRPVRGWTDGGQRVAWHSGSAHRRARTGCLDARGNQYGSEQRRPVDHVARYALCPPDDSGSAERVEA